MIRLLRSEWAKVRTLRPMLWVLALVVIVVAAAGYLMSRGVGAWDTATPAQRASLLLPAVERLVMPLLQLGAAGFGVLAITSEYGGGTIRTSLAAVPQRLRLYVAKATVATVVAFLGGLGALAAAGVLVRAVVADRPVASVEMLVMVDDKMMLLASVASLSAVTLIAIGLGALTRAPAGTLGGLAVLLFGPSMAAAYLPGDWGACLAALALPELPRQVAVHGGLHGPLTPGQAVGVMMLYPMVALLAGGIRFMRSDA